MEVQNKSRKDALGSNGHNGFPGQLHFHVTKMIWISECRSAEYCSTGKRLFWEQLFAVGWLRIVPHFKSKGNTM